MLDQARELTVAGWAAGSMLATLGVQAAQFPAFAEYGILGAFLAYLAWTAAQERAARAKAEEKMLERLDKQLASLEDDLKKERRRRDDEHREDVRGWVD